MGLRRAESAHPLAQMSSAPAEVDTALVAAPAPEQPPAPSAPVTAPVAKKARKRASAPDRPVHAVPDSPAPSRTPRTTKTAKVKPGALPSLPGRPDAPVQVARRAGLSLRGKKDVALWMRAVDADRIRSAYREARPTYRSLRTTQDPDGVYQLTLSAFTWQALNYALDHVGEWIADIPNDARFEPPTEKVARKHVAVGWLQTWIDRYHESWEILEAQYDWPEGFTLTKANLSATGILWALDRVQDWLAETPNDDRFSEPIEGDKRLRPAVKQQQAN